MGVRAVVHLLGTLRPGGGPSGYLYNLREACSAVADCPIGFAADAVEHRREPLPGNGPAPLPARMLARLAPDGLLSAWAARRARADTGRMLHPELASQLHGADAVVVHDWLMFHHYLNWRARFGRPEQLAILMDHSPRSPNELVADDWALRWGLPRKTGVIGAAWEPFVLEAFRRADAIMVPNSHALDAYYPDDAPKRRLILSKAIYELASGVPALTPSGNREQVRREIGLPNAALVVGYLGRHDREKGYDIFVETARQAAADRRFEDVRFVSAGQGPLKSANPPPNLVQLGWREDAASVLDACDMLLAPNRFAYFDLAILEAMSLGKTVFTTFVGGSKGLVPGSVSFLKETSPSALAAEFLSSIRQPLLDPADVRKAFAAHYSETVFLRHHLQFAGDIRRRLGS